jgi:hypothetical protein
MQIQNSQSMIEHIENGGNFTLDKQGQLETQSVAGRFFQKIGDAFRSLTTAGRAAIETRNTNLHMAMANMLRDDTLVNPTQGEIPRPATQTERNALAMRLGMAQALRNFPPIERAAARNLGLQLLQHQGLPEGNSAEVRGKTLDVMNKIRNDPAVSYALHCDYSTPLQLIFPALGNDLRAAFTKEQGNIGQDGIHENFLKDATTNLRTINGQPSDDPWQHADEPTRPAVLMTELKDQVPNEKIRGFIAMAASDAGLVKSLSTQIRSPDNVRFHPPMSGEADMQAKGLRINNSYQYDVRVEGGKARVTLEADYTVGAAESLQEVAKALGIDASTWSAEPGVPIGGGRYTIDLVVDLNQNMDGRDIPRFTLENGNRVSAPIEQVNVRDY